jgi:hypothetical protein
MAAVAEAVRACAGRGAGGLAVAVGYREGHQTSDAACLLPETAGALPGEVESPEAAARVVPCPPKTSYPRTTLNTRKPQAWLPQKRCRAGYRSCLAIAPQVRRRVPPHSKPLSYVQSTAGSMRPLTV